MKSKENLFEKLDRFCFLLICILMADCCIFGPGRFIEIGPLGFRMALLGFTLLCAFPLMLKNVLPLLKSRFAQIILVFLAWLILSAVRGIVYDNSIAHLISDLKGFAYLAFLPAVLTVVNSKERIHTLMKVMMYSVTALAGVVILSLLVYLLFPSTLFAPLYRVLSMSHGKEYGIASFTAISRDILRIYFYSGLYFLCGCAFSVYFQINSKEFQWKYAVILGLCLFSLLMTFTRSVYFAAFVAAAALIVVLVVKAPRREKKRMAQQLGAGVLVLVVLLSVFGIATGEDYFRYGLSRVFVTFAYDLGDDPNMEGVDPSEGEFGDGEDSEEDTYNKITAQSDQLRAMTAAEMMENIKKSPIIGNGLGVALTCRPDGYGEYFYLDLISKTGILGTLLYLMPLIYMILVLITDRTMTKSGRQTAAMWVVALLGMCVYSYFNPYMNAALGVLFYCCTMAVFQQCRTGTKA